MPKLSDAIGEVVDWEEVAKAELIEPGNYPARLDSLKLQKSERTGNEYWSGEFTLIGEGEYEGRKVFDVFMLDKQFLWKLRSLAEAMGMDVEQGWDPDTEELEGQEVGIVTVHREYEGRTRNQVKGYFKLAATAPAE